jgi:hypothetical protein
MADIDSKSGKNTGGTPDTPRQDTPPSDVTGTHPDDARDDPAQQQRNREDMGVAEDHLTEKMKEQKRGTFP